MSISALTDFIAVSGLIGSALYDDKKSKNFSQSAARIAIAFKPVDSSPRRCEDMMIWLADAVLVVHALIALFIVGGLAAIWVGSGLGWEWVHSWLFRLAHLFAIGLASTLSLLGLACPLTVLEDWLRIGSVGGRSGVGRLG
jgi:hypothetical protein